MEKRFHVAYFYSAPRLNAMSKCPSYSVGYFPNFIWIGTQLDPSFLDQNSTVGYNLSLGHLMPPRQDWKTAPYWSISITTTVRVWSAHPQPSLSHLWLMVGTNLPVFFVEILFLKQLPLHRFQIILVHRAPTGEQLLHNGAIHNFHEWSINLSPSQ